MSRPAGSAARPSAASTTIAATSRSRHADVFGTELCRVDKGALAPCPPPHPGTRALCVDQVGTLRFAYLAFFYARNLQHSLTNAGVGCRRWSVGYGYNEYGQRSSRHAGGQHADAGRSHDHEIERGCGEIRGPDPAGRGRAECVAGQCCRRRRRQSQYLSLNNHNQGAIAAVISLTASSLPHSAGPAMVAISQPWPSTSTEVGIPNARPILLRS